ncbi:hypothetical protein [Streptomyces sp. NPDC020141]|uniref:hypothetical protein n=1 Tax=Streptomyces sp. NPDC020141 TaxID=3365065 RepID=UPI0037A1EF9A
MPIAGNLLSANAESIETDSSAWAAVLNASGLARAAGGTLGDYCLQLKSTAVGDCQVGLVTRVAVTPGSRYLAFASVWTPVAGGSGRVMLRWHTSGGSVISTTSGPTVTPVSPSWNQTAIIATAPANAATVNVLIGVGGVSAGQTWFADRIFLGPVPDVVSGNLLSWEAEDVEVDASAWTAAGNAVVGVQQTSVQRYQSLRLTSVAAGDASVRTVSASPVTAGSEYIAHCYAIPGTSGLTARMQIQWLNAGGTVLSTSSADWTLTAGSWRRIAVIATAPSGTATARVVVVGAATAAAQTWTVDRVVLSGTAALTTPGNFLPYNASDIEVDASAWTVDGGTVAQTSEQILSGAYALKAVATGGVPMSVTTVVPAGRVTAGLGHEFNPPVQKGALAPVGAGYETRIDWLDSTGTVVRSRWQGWASGSITGWMAGSIADICPDTAVSARLTVTVETPGAGEIWYLDRAHFGVGGLTLDARLARGGVALTARGLSTPGPTWKWDLTRLLPGEAPQPVRGWSGDLISQATTSDIAVITDYEAPVGVPVQWRITTTHPSGASSGRISYTSDPVTLEASDTDVWIKDPGLPARSVRATVGVPLPTWTRAARQGVNQVRGRSRPVVIADVRGAPTGSLVLVTATEDDTTALWWVLSAGGPLLIQWPPGWGQRDMYVAVGDVTEAPITRLAEHHDRTWTLPLTEVDRPIGGIAGSADRTWDTVRLSGDTWVDALSAAASWLGIYTGTGL